MVGGIIHGAFGQETISGRVFELNTRIHLPQINILNTTTGKTSQTDSTGAFRIPGRNGDLLVFSGFAYQTDSILIIDKTFREIFLQPKQHALREVKINSAPVNIGEYRHPEFHGQTVVYQRDDDGNYKGGVAIRLSYWKKDSKRERRSHKRLKQAETETEIYNLFSPLNVGNYIPLKGRELQNFIDLYQPSVDLFRSGRFDFLYYLNEKYKEYLSLSEDKRKLPALKN